jgi:hypothetical protein
LPKEFFRFDRPKYAPSSDNEEEQNESNDESEEEVVKPRARLTEPLKTNSKKFHKFKTRLL